MPVNKKTFKECLTEALPGGRSFFIMGRIKHHAIVVTGNYPSICQLRDTAIDFIKKYELDFIIDVENIVSEVIITVNHYASFFIAPDGSKEGWETSNKFDGFRNEFIQHLKSEKRCDWALISFGGDDDFKSIQTGDDE